MTSTLPLVLALKPGHDGALAAIDSGRLLFSFEGEKDSMDRNGPLNATCIADAFARLPAIPEAIGLGGWHKSLPGLMGTIGAGYRGVAPGTLERTRCLGTEVLAYSSSHERSHLFGAVGMSPFDPESCLAVLVWEGVIGSIYRWSGAREPIEAIPVLDQPGARFSALFCIADPAFPEVGAFPEGNQAGKLMALAGYADGLTPSADSMAVVDSLLRLRALYPFEKRRYRTSALFNCGVVAPEFCRAARHLADKLFDTFENAARAAFPDGERPLVIGGGCGLNCDWNQRWRESDVFSDVFVPPCTNDSGSAIGTAIDTQVQLGGPCSLAWNVYQGPSFVVDCRPTDEGWAVTNLNHSVISEALSQGEVIPFISGDCEIGPRALGNRSLLADATDIASRDRLNAIKQRETYRPIAPVCIVEELRNWFDADFEDPYMLYFRQHTTDRLPAVRHADGSARVQTVSRRHHGQLHDLLRRHSDLTGVGVLCNTSLNFPGRGFINRMSELLHFCSLNQIRWIAFDDEMMTHPDDG